MRWLALGGVAGPVVFGSVVVVCAGVRGDYSHVSQFISELGARGTQHAGWMNFAGFLPAGLLLAGFGASLARLVPGGRLRTVAAVLVAAFGVGLALAGVFPCEPGCPQDEPTIHDSVSAGAFLAAIAGSALFAGVFRGRAEWRPLWGYSAATSVVALGFFALLVATLESRTLVGIWQRLMLGTLFVWCAVVGLRAFWGAGRGDWTA